MTGSLAPPAPVQWLGSLTGTELRLAGGKAATLARLRRYGYAVPHGFVILPAAFAGDELRPGAWDQVQAFLEQMRGGSKEVSFAVRSSAVGEDSARASFAGQFETVLDVANDAAVREAIATVRRSRHGQRAQTYSRARGLAANPEPGSPATGSPEMAVIVQRLVRADFAGILFTADPVTGSREHMVGSAVRGLGDGLVSGQVEGQAFTLAQPKGRHDGPPELEHLARRLFRLGSRLEREFGGPQDIEWAEAQERSFGLNRDRLYLLQSRPITSLDGFNPLTGEYNDTLTGDYVWSCVNIGEAMSVVVTPFTWSVVSRAFDELNILPGIASAGNIAGRAYQNVTVMASMLRAMGRKVEGEGQELGGVRDEYLEVMDQYLVPLPQATLWAILPGAIRFWRKQRAGLKRLPAFLDENPTWCQTCRQRIESIQRGDELAAFFPDEFMPYTLATFWRTVATAWRYADQVGRLRSELKESVGVADADVLMSNVSGPGEVLASLGPVIDLAKVARGEMARSAYLERWGHRGPLETETSIPRPAEDPQWLDDQLASFNRFPVDTEALLAARRAEFEAAWARMCQKREIGGSRSLKARSMRRRLAKAAEAARLREAVRSEFTRLVWVGRAWALRAGALTGIGEGVFFLTLDELVDLLSGDEAKGMPVAAIPARRRTHERYKALPPLPLMIRGRFDPFQWAADPHRRSDVFDSHGLLETLTLEGPSEQIILGMPGSAGQAEGLVRRLDEPREGGLLEPGEILVTSQTNIGWTLCFPKAAAIVTDVGAPLSHAAIVARELGIPAVVNCGVATARLRTGDRVRVDGAQGVVEILERQS